MTVAPGWHPDPQNPNIERWWDGNAWTAHARQRAQYAPQPQPQAQPQPQIVVVQTAPQQPARQAADKAQYVRQQQGHSLVLHLLIGVCCLWINVIYLSASPNHYWHA
jgi:hypothetical protein